MKKIALTLAFCFLFTSIHAIEGTYSVSGYDPYEKVSYTGKATISKGANNVYNVEWVFNDGEKYQGTGLKSDSEVSFAFLKQNSQKPNFGIQVYKINGTTLTGSWVMLNQTLLGKETLQKQ